MKAHLSVSVCLQFRSRRSSARCVLPERCVTVFVLTLLYTHMLAWQPDTHSWSWMEQAYVKKQKTKTNTIYQRTGRLGDIAEEYTHHVTATITQDGPIRSLVLQHVFLIVLYF